MPDFDPENVKSLWLDYEDEKGGSWEGDFVFKSDYDDLLELYRQHIVVTDEKIGKAAEQVIVPLFTKFVKYMAELPASAEPPTIEVLMEFLMKQEEAPNGL